MSDGQRESNLIPLGGLWLNTSKDGKKKYMSGNLTSRVKILIFKNTKKMTDKHPDYNMFLAPIQKPPEERQPNADAQAPEPDEGAF